MSEISIAQAKAGFASLVARAEAGEQIVVTRNGRPVACLGPLPKTKPPVYGDLQGLWVADDLWTSDDFSLPQDVLDDFEKSIEDFDKYL
jgi:prevent-host-death family protein